MSDQTGQERAAPRFHVAILEDDGVNARSRHTRLILTPEGSAQEALGDLLKYASPSADATIVAQHVAAILHGSAGMHLVGTWPPNVPAGGQSASADRYCAECGQKVS
jgi:hypothetical protein